MKSKSHEPDDLNAKLTERFEALFGANEGPSGPADAHRSTEFAARMAAEFGLEDGWAQSGPVLAGIERAVRLAAWLDCKPCAQGKESDEVAAPEALQEALASLSFIERVVAHPSPAPGDRVEAALAIWHRSRDEAAPKAEVLPWRPHQRNAGAAVSAPLEDSFLLLAAADAAREPAVVCRSQSGLWTLEVFVENPEHGGPSGEGYLLLSVHPDHRMTYEGRNARVFVMIDNTERVLVHAPVRGGEVYAPIVLAGLDLWTRDAVNVVFSACPNGS